MREKTIVGLIVERRAVAIVVLCGTEILHAEKRYFIHVEAEASKTVIALLACIIQDFSVWTVVMFQSKDTTTMRRNVLSKIAKEFCLSSGIPIWEVSRAELLASYLLPPTAFRVALRRAALKHWAGIIAEEASGYIIEALALAQFVQVEVLLNEMEAV